MVHSVSTEMMVSTGGADEALEREREERMVEVCSAPQERMRSVPSDSWYPASLARARMCGCMSVLGSKATYFEVLARLR